MFKNKKILLTILLIFIVSIISFFIGTNLANKNIIRNQSIETQKLTETSEENTYVKTIDHLAEVNSSIQSGIEQGKLATWESIRNSEIFSSRTDSSGNPIYGDVTDLESLKNAIDKDNKNSVGDLKYTAISSGSCVRHGEDTAAKSFSLSGLEVGKNYCLLVLANSPAVFPTLSQTMNTTTEVLNGTVGHSPGNQWATKVWLCTFTAQNTSITINQAGYYAGGACQTFATIIGIN